MATLTHSCGTLIPRCSRECVVLIKDERRARRRRSSCESGRKKDDTVHQASASGDLMRTTAESVKLAAKVHSELVRSLK